MRRIFVFILLIYSVNLKSQEFNCVVNINSAEIGISNRQVFNTMQNAIFEYMNNTKWTNIPYKNHEKINCSLTINILEIPSANQYKGTLQLQVSRPVYNTTYQTPILVFNDDKINFNYEEFQPLVYNENNYTSNLVSLLTYYAYTILGFHADTFGYKGGENYFKLAENVVNISQQDGGSGWNRIDGNDTRYTLNDNILSPAFEAFRKTMYEYHRLGLDTMADNAMQAKEQIAASIIGLQPVFDGRPNTFMVRIFMDTKSDEIEDIFSDGPSVNIAELKEVLGKMSPINEAKWQNIKN